VARILRPRGNQGEVIAELLTDSPERFASCRRVYLRKANEEPQSVPLERFWLDRNHPGMGVFHLSGCASIDDAEKWRGSEVLLPIGERITLPAGKHFVSDLVGCTVFEVAREDSKLASAPCSMDVVPRVVGTVREVFFPGEDVAGTPLLQVETAAGELLVPLAEEICTLVDVRARRIEVQLPAGLSELNVPG
jgi:16S rRNA processing protein RimM